MKNILLCIIGYVSCVSRPFRFPNLLESRTVLISSGTTIGVAGMCSKADDGIGKLFPASSSGISELNQCAQYVKEHETRAKYVTFSSVQNSCIWFESCPCLSSGSTCLGGDDWSSVAIADIIQTSQAVVQTVPPPGSNSAIAKLNTDSTSSGSSSTNEEAQCDTSSSDLMQYFQSKCAMSDNMWISRIIALSMAVVVLLIFGAGFSVAFWLDREELAKLYPEESPVTQ